MEIKKVAHLYLGCEVHEEDCPVGSKAYLDQVDTGGDCVVNYYREVNGEQICDTEPIMMPIDIVTLKLRRIEHVSEEDERVLHSLEKSFEDKPHLNIEMWAAMANKYRELGYDIDGLIKSGQAIDVTQVK